MLIDRLACISTAFFISYYKKIKICQSDPFNRKDEDKLKIFFLQFKLYFCAAPAKFAHKSDKVNFILIYLKGMPLNLVESFISNLNISPEWLNNYLAF